MRYLKSILLALIVSVAVLTGIGFLLKPAYKIEKSILIKAPSDSILPFLVNLKKWPEWSAWNTKKDPTLKFVYTGPEQGTGAKQEWKGEVLDKGAVEITGINKRSAVNHKFQLEEDFVSNGFLTLESQGKNTKVIWKIEGNVGSNIPQRYFLIFMEKLISTDMEEGMSKLKKICESE